MVIFYEYNLRFVASLKRELFVQRKDKVGRKNVWCIQEGARKIECMPNTHNACWYNDSEIHLMRS